MHPHLYKRPCQSVGWLIGWLVGPSVIRSSKSMKNRLLRILNDLDSAGRGRRKEAREEGGMGRKEGRGGRRDEESKKMKKLLKK